jgi:DNA-binding NarL/FixJ family response regulator
LEEDMAEFLGTDGGQIADEVTGLTAAAEQVVAGWSAVCWDAASPQRGRNPAAPPGLAEPLAGRELEVLRLIAAGRSNQRIACDLVVAFDTAKSI